MNDKELIAEALRWANGHPNRRPSELMRALADALESRQPSENDREATEAEIDKAARALHMAKCCSLSGDSPHDFPEASEVFAAGVVLNAVPRAAVPDAATEELLKRVEEAEAQSAEDRVEWQQMKERASQRFNAYQQKKRELRQMEIRAEKAEAERAAAREAIERVRAIHVESDWKCGNPRHTNPKVGCPECYTECETCDRTYPCDTRAALDGAPEPEEPEWEYSWEGEDNEGPYIVDAAFESADEARTEGARYPWLGNSDVHMVRRRKAGPWEFVEGKN